MLKIIKTALHPPVQAAMLRREHLLQKLQQQQDKRFILLKAGPGSGKTLLAASYYLQVKDRIWLAIPEKDFGFHDLLTHLVYALNEELHCPECIGLLGLTGELQTAELIRRLINLLTEQVQGKLFIFIDGLQHLQFLPGERENLLEVFFSFLPAQVQMILTCDRDLPFPLIRLGQMGEMYQLEERLLQFSAEENTDVEYLEEHAISPDSLVPGGSSWSQVESRTVVNGDMRESGLATRGAGGRTLSENAGYIMRFQFFGGFQISNGQRLIKQDDWANKKASNLLKFLILNRSNPVLQDRILELFWPGHEVVKARQNMYVAINVIRKTLEPTLDNPKESHYIISQHGYCKFNTQQPYWLDLDDLENNYAEGLWCYNRQLYRKAEEYFTKARGLFKLGFLPENSNDKWCAEHRMQYHKIFLEMNKVLFNQLRESDPVRALEYGLEIYETEPYLESLNLAMLQLLLKLGEPQRAVELYARMSTAYERDLMVEIPLALQMFYQALRDDGAALRA